MDDNDFRTEVQLLNTKQRDRSIWYVIGPGKNKKFESFVTEGVGVGKSFLVKLLRNVFD